jgi:parvulin-like peptidyl-prolyl isomerase
MYRVIRIAIIVFNLLILLNVSTVYAAWPWKPDHLVTINGLSYTGTDYKHWWDFKREPDSKVPETPQSFIEWKLLVQEAISMELDLEPRYQKEMQTFLGARSRLLLKNETVDSKIKITEDDIMARYESDYSPIWQMNLLYFESAEKAQAAYNGMENKTYSYQAFENFSKDEGGPIQIKKGKFRPKNFKTNKELLEDVKRLSVGEVTVPHQLGDYFVLFYLVDLELPEPNEFETKKQYMREIAWKQKQAELTYELIDELKIKFDVRVDEDLLAKTDVNLRGEILTKPVVTTKVENIPLGVLVKDLRSEYKMRQKDDWTEAQKQNIIEGLLNGIIADYILKWEAQERRYEEHPPFKWDYEFYKEKKLIREMEKRLIASQITVNDQEINAYYKERLDQFRPPPILSLLLLYGEKEKVERAFPDIINGKDFAVTGEKYQVAFNPMYNIPARQVAPLVRQKTATLDPGAISQPFEMNKDYYIVKLVDRKIQEPVPVEKVKDKISIRIKNEKFIKLRQQHVDMLLERSEISVNRKEWDKLKENLTH